jgi:GNAT superfamily N-acetyltransferase
MIEPQRESPMPARDRPESGRAVACTLRPARPGEADAIGDVYWRSRTQLLDVAPLPYSRDEVDTWIRDLLLPSGEIVVAVVDDRIVGLNATSHAYGVMWIDQLYVDPNHIGQGIGSALMQYTLDRARTAGMPVQLDTFSRNAPARAFYERHGFVVVSEQDGSDNEEGVPDVLYQRTFAREPSSAE